MWLLGIFLLKHQNVYLQALRSHGNFGSSRVSIPQNGSQAKTKKANIEVLILKNFNLSCVSGFRLCTLLNISWLSRQMVSHSIFYHYRINPKTKVYFPRKPVLWPARYLLGTTDAHNLSSSIALQVKLVEKFLAQEKYTQRRSDSQVCDERSTIGKWSEQVRTCCSNIGSTQELHGDSTFTQ